MIKHRFFPFTFFDAMPSDAVWLAFIDEALPAARSSELEAALRDDPAMRAELDAVRGRQAAGIHAIGAIWRRRNLSCPDREDLGAYVMGVLPDDQTEFIRTHIEIVGCRLCAANLDDLKTAESSVTPADEVLGRRTRYFQTSIGRLKKPDDPS